MLDFIHQYTQRKENVKMEWLDTILQTISNLGFPIAACIFLAKYISDQSKEHKEEMAVMTDALNKNTQAILVMSEKIDELVKGK